MKRLNQIVAIEKEVRARTTNATSEIFHQLDKAELLEGFSKEFKPLNEDEERFPNESKNVSLRADEALRKAFKAKVEQFDVEASKNLTNMSAKADVVVDGEVILKDVPATTLLYLEKELSLEVKKFIEKTKTLDVAEQWSPRGADGLFRSSPSTTHKTKKVAKAIVLYPATTEHPAQTQMVTEDVTIGHWTTVKLSGALPRNEKEAALEKVNKLIDAIKAAREQANMAEAQEQKVGQAIFDFIGL